MSQPVVTYGAGTIVPARPQIPKGRTPPTLSKERRQEIALNNQLKQEKIEREIEEWWDEGELLAKKLADKYGKKKEHYLSLMYHGATKMYKARGGNSYNAWSHSIAKRAADNGDTRSLLELQQEYRHEYDALTADEKKQLVDELLEERKSRSFGTRLTQKSITKDVDNVEVKMKELFRGLESRVRVAGFFCIVKATPGNGMTPRFWYTNPELETYLTSAVKRWDTAHIAGLTEAFSVAGCDFTSFLKAAKSKAQWLKNDIRERINRGLAEITGNPNVAMKYINFDTEISLVHGVKLVGWTHPTWANPSELSNNVPLLQELQAALETEECRFERCTVEDLQRIRQEQVVQAEAGSARQRKPRKDKGVTRGPNATTLRKRAREEVDTNEGASGEMGPATKRIMNESA